MKWLAVLAAFFWFFSVGQSLAAGKGVCLSGNEKARLIAAYLLGGAEIAKSREVKKDGVDVFWLKLHPGKGEEMWAKIRQKKDGVPYPVIISGPRPE